MRRTVSLVPLVIVAALRTLGVEKHPVVYPIFKYRKEVGPAGR